MKATLRSRGDQLFRRNRLPKNVVGEFIVQLVNSGRANTAAKVHQLLSALHKAEPNADVVTLIEVDEGDKGYNEEAIVRSVWRVLFWRQFRKVFTGHERIMVNRKRRLAGKSEVFSVAHTSVPHQSPQRPIQRVPIKVGTDSVAQYGLHPAAGAYNGDRPPITKALLIRSWDLTMSRLKDLVANDHDNGVSSIISIDGNRPHMDIKVFIHPRAVLLAQHGPDMIIGVPAENRAFALNGRVILTQGFEPEHAGMTLHLQLLSV